MLVATDSTIAGNREVFLLLVNSILGDHPRGSMIDMCSHVAPITRTLGFESRTYVDILERDLGDEQPNFICCDALGEHEAFNRRYDAALCFDGIEHLYKQDGFALLDRMHDIASMSILFTPSDPWCIDMKSTNPEAHRSLWGPQDVPKYASLMMPSFHERLGIGAFMFWHCEDLCRHFNRVVSTLNESGLVQFEIQ